MRVGESGRRCWPLSALPRATVGRRVQREIYERKGEEREGEKSVNSFGEGVKSEDHLRSDNICMIAHICSSNIVFH